VARALMFLKHEIPKMRMLTQCMKWLTDRMQWVSQPLVY